METTGHAPWISCGVGEKVDALCLSSWKDEDAVYWVGETGEAGREWENQSFGFGQVDFGIPIRHLGSEVEWDTGISPMSQLPTCVCPLCFIVLWGRSSAQFSKHFHPANESTY